MSSTLAIRVDRANPDHHIWLNNGTWWCHFTVHLTGFRAKRVRRSLSTDNRLEARQRRDSLFVTLDDAGSEPSGRLS